MSLNLLIRVVIPPSTDEYDMGSQRPILEREIQRIEYHQYDVNKKRYKMGEYGIQGLHCKKTVGRGAGMELLTHQLKTPIKYCYTLQDFMYQD